MIEGWVEVFSAGSELEAQLVRDNLRNEGLEAEVYSQASHVYPVEMGDLNVIRVLVPTEQEEQARGVLDEHSDADGDVSFPDEQIDADQLPSDEPGVGEAFGSVEPQRGVADPS